MDFSDALALADVDAVGQAALLAAGEVSAAELLEAAILRVEATRGLNAVITDLFDRGRGQAEQIDGTSAAGPLCGVPEGGIQTQSLVLGCPYTERCVHREVRHMAQPQCSMIINRLQSVLSSP